MNSETTVIKEQVDAACKRWMAEAQALEDLLKNLSPSTSTEKMDELMASEETAWNEYLQLHERYMLHQAIRDSASGERDGQ